MCSTPPDQSSLSRGTGCQDFRSGNKTLKNLKGKKYMWKLKEAAIPVDGQGQQRIAKEIVSFPGKLHLGVRPDVQGR